MSTPNPGPIPVPVMAPTPVMAPSPAPGAVWTPNGPAPAFGSLFKPSTSIVTPPRLALSLDALDKCGKSHWALYTTPEPVAIVVTDEGTAHVIRKAQADGRKISGVLDLLYPDAETPGKSEANAAMHGEWVHHWKLFKEGMRAVAADRTIKTLIRDTESEIWQLCQLAHFGRTTQIPQHLRTQCNADYLSTFRMVYGRPDLNIVLVHKVKKEYKPNAKGENDWTGEYERDGMNKIGFSVDLTLRAGWDGLRRCFYTHAPSTQATRYGSAVAGKYWYGDDSGFGYLGIELFPETEMTPEVWGL